MKLHYRTRDGRMTVELEADTQTELWKELSRFQEVFELGPVRAKIGDKVLESNNIKYNVRTDKDENEYLEAICMEDGPLKWFKVQMGQHKKGGGLFPKRPDRDDKNYQWGLGGWSKWVGQKENKETSDSETPF